MAYRFSFRDCYKYHKLITHFNKCVDVWTQTISPLWKMEDKELYKGLWGELQKASNTTYKMRFRYRNEWLSQ